MLDRLVDLRGCIIVMMLSICDTCEFSHMPRFETVWTYTDHFPPRSGFKWADVGFPFPDCTDPINFYTSISSHLSRTCFFFFFLGIPAN
jgi:hypothetical protein